MQQGTSTIPSQDPASVARRYFEATKSRDVVNILASFPEDVVWHQPGQSPVSGTFEGRERLFEMLLNFEDLSGGTFKVDSIESLMANGNMVAGVISYSAERQGKKLSLTGVDVLRIESGKIKEVWVFSPDQDAEDRFWS
jgi:ketosteroid isomerase-like protein